jgi:hypothetical protein
MRNVIAAGLASVMLFGGAAWAQTSASGSAASGPFTVSAEALLWWFKSSPTPVPLVTDEILNDQDFPAKILLGGGDLNSNPNPGFRGTVGYSPGAGWGVEGSVLYIPTRSTSRSVASSGQIGSTNLLLPYIDALTGEETVSELSLQPIYRGSAREELSQSLLGAEVYGTWAVVSAPSWRLDVLGGLRWLRLRETYTFTTSSPFIPPNPVDIWNTTDKFDTFNNFYGVQLGARGRYDWGPLFATGTVKVGIGAMRQTVEISGFLVTDDFTDSGSAQRFAGGYFALPSNIGDHSRTVFGVVPEATLHVGYQITPGIAVFVGYTMLYANDVARPGNQINRTINTTQSVSWVGQTTFRPEGPAQPSFRFKSSDFWAQGVDLGLSFRF